MRAHCPSCGARWRGQGNRWCGRCGAPLVDDGAALASRRWSVRGSRTWPPWLTALAGFVAGIVLVSAVIGSGILTDRRDDRLGVVPDAEVDLPLDSTGQAAPGRGPVCEPEGCEHWQTRQIRRGPVAAAGEQVVHVDIDTVTAFDLASGRVLWTAPAPGSERAGTGMASLIHLDEDRLLVGYSQTEDGDTARLLAYDTADGEIRFDTELDQLRMIFALTWRDDRALVFGTAAPSVDLEGSPRSLLLGVAADGTLAWQLDGFSIPGLDVDRPQLLARKDGELMRLDPHDGAVLWSRSSASAAVRGGHEHLVVDRDAGRVTRIDLSSGSAEDSIAADGVEAAVAVGPWIGVVVDGTLEVRRPRPDEPAGEELFTREASDVFVTSVVADDRVIAAWARQGRGEVEVATYRLDDASLLHRSTVEVAIDAQPLSLTATGDPDAPQEPFVSLVVDQGAKVTLIDIASGDVLREVMIVPDHVVAQAQRIEWLGGLSIVSLEDGTLAVYGPDGVIEVRGASEVVATAPLIVRGSGGLLVLDRSFVEVGDGS